MPEYESHVTVNTTLASAVASAGTFLVGYPAGYDESMFAEQGHKISVKNGGDYISPRDFTVAFGNTGATVTWNDSLTLAAGTELWVELDVKGGDGEIDVRVLNAGRVGKLYPVILNLGAPDASDVDGILEAYTGSAPALDGDLVTGGVATFDVPRNIIVDSGGADTAVLTFTGTDEYGNTMVESITLNGTTAAVGNKAFKTVTGVTSSGAIANGAFAGTGVKLGLPIYLDDADFVLSEQEDGAAASAGTIVAGANVKATATTGDVRGTYTPNSTPDGDKNFSLIVLAEDPNNTGGPQYAG